MCFYCLQEYTSCAGSGSCAVCKAPISIRFECFSLEQTQPVDLLKQQEAEPELAPVMSAADAEADRSAFGKSIDEYELVEESKDYDGPSDSAASPTASPM